MTVDRDTHRTPGRMDDEPEPDSTDATPAQGSQPWLVVSLVFVILLIAIIAWIILRPA
jgi:flagellar biogenesis protein FliO